MVRGLGQQELWMRVLLKGSSDDTVGVSADLVVERVSGEEADNLVDRAAALLPQRLSGERGDVRGGHRGGPPRAALGQWFLTEHIEQGADPARFHFGEEGRLLDERRARGVHEHGAVAEQGEPDRVEQSPGLGQHGSVQRHDVRPAQQVVQSHKFRAELRRIAGVGVGVVQQAPAAEGTQTVQGGPSRAARPDDADGLLLTSPAGRGAMMYATLAYQAIQTVIQSLVIVVIALVAGACFPGGVAARQAMLAHTGWSTVWTHVGLLTAAVVVMGFLATRAFRTYRKST